MAKGRPVLIKVDHFRQQGGSLANFRAGHRAARKLAVPLFPLNDFGFEMRYAWGATAPTRPALRTSFSVPWVSRRTDFDQIVATVGDLSVGRDSPGSRNGRFAIACLDGGRALQRSWALSLSDGDGEPMAHYAVCKPFGSNADAVLAKNGLAFGVSSLQGFFHSGRPVRKNKGMPDRV